MNPNRRDALKAALGATSLLSMGTQAPSFLTRAAHAAGPDPAPARDTVLVVVQLAGGNDGLNTVVPHRDDAYARSRPTLRLNPGSLHRLDEDLGLHPSMGPMAELYREGLVCILQGVGYPNPNGGHSESMHIWQTADPASLGGQTGWLGRAIDAHREADPSLMPGAFVGSIAQPLAVNAARSIVPTYRSLGDAFVPGLGSGAPAQASAGRGGPSPSLADFLDRTAGAAADRSRRIETLADAPTGPYPAFQLAGQLRLAAQLIRADVGLRLIYTELGGAEPGGFDTHAGQALNHGALLEQLSASVAAFIHDLRRDGQLDRVALVTFSEFGRTVAENGRRGTDHGSAQPLFLAGGKLRGGLVGSHSSLDVLEGGGQKHHTDFRRVYATLLDRWLGLDSPPILGSRFEPLDLFTA